MFTKTLHRVTIFDMGARRFINLFNTITEKKHVKDFIVFFVLLFIAFIWGANNGLNMYLDTYNYHIYNPWAFLHNRIDIDFMAADIQSYFNPLLDLPAYFLIKYLNNFPRLALGLNNLWYGFFAFILYKIMDVFFKNKGIEKFISIFLCMVLALTAPILIHEVNSLFNDIQIGIAVLLSLFILFKYLYKEDSKKRTCMIALAGFIMGTMTGFKLTSCFYCFSFFLTLLILHKDYQKPFKTISYFSIFIIIGFLVIDGFWLWTVYSHFKNPFFPYFNNIFKSPYAETDLVLNTDFAHLKPKSLMNFFFYPFYGILERKMNGCERIFFDARYIFSYISIYFAGFLMLLKNTWQKGVLIDEQYEKFLFLFVFLSYSLGMIIFSQYRYFIPLNALAGILIFIWGYATLKSKKLLIIVCSFIFIMILYTDVRINDTINRNLPKNYVFKVENVEIPDNSLVILASRATAAMAVNQNLNVKYIYLAFPDDVDITGAFFMSNVYFKSKYIEKRLTEEISKHANNTYLLYKSNIASKDMKIYEKSLDKYSNGRYKELTNCKIINHNNNPMLSVIFKYKICKVVMEDK